MSGTVLQHGLLHRPDVNKILSNIDKVVHSAELERAGGNLSPSHHSAANLVIGCLQAEKVQVEASKISRALYNAVCWGRGYE